MKALVGSHFWNMNVAESDEDYGEFIVPTKEDLFYGKNAANGSTDKDQDGNDITKYDVRQLLFLMKKGSSKCFEFLYSLDPLEIDPVLELAYNYRDELYLEFRDRYRRAFYHEANNRMKMCDIIKDKAKTLAHVSRLIKCIYSENPFKEAEKIGESVRALRTDFSEKRLPYIQKDLQFTIDSFLLSDILFKEDPEEKPYYKLCENEIMEKIFLSFK